MSSVQVVHLIKLLQSVVAFLRLRLSSQCSPLHRSPLLLALPRPLPKLPHHVGGEKFAHP